MHDVIYFFFFSSRRRHTRFDCDWSSDVCSSDLYRSREKYEASAKFTTWLYRIATNLAVNHARDTRHERPENIASLNDPDENTGAAMDVPDDSRNAEEILMRRYQ